MQKHQPALLGGLFIGVLSVLPIVSAANCCCLWVIVGGVLVVYLQQQKKPTPVEIFAFPTPSIQRIPKSQKLVHKRATRS